MADYPGQQPGGNPGNYPQRPPHGYPMQPQNQPMFRAQHQGYNRPSPSYPQQSPAGQSAPQMGQYQQIYHGSPHQMPINSQMASRHFMGQPTGSPHMQNMNQGSPLVYSNPPQSSNQYSMNQGSPAMINAQRFASPQMPQNIHQQNMHGLPPQSIPQQNVSQNMSSNIPQNIPSSQPQHISSNMPPQNIQSHQQNYTMPRPSSAQFQREPSMRMPSHPGFSSMEQNPQQNHIPLQQQQSQPYLSSNHQVQSSFQPQQQPVSNQIDYKSLHPQKATVVNNKNEDIQEEIQWIHPASLALNRLLDSTGNSDLYKMKSNKELRESRKQLRTNALIKRRNELVSNINNIDENDELDDNIYLRRPLVRCELNVRRKYTIAKFAVKNKKGKDDDKNVVDEMKDKADLSNEKDEIHVEESTSEKMDVDHPKEDKDVIIVDSNGKEIEGNKKRGKGIEYETRLILVAENVYGKKQLVKPNIVPVRDPKTHSYHSGNFWPNRKSTNLPRSTVRTIAFENSLHRRRLQETDEFRITDPDEWYRQLNESSQDNQQVASTSYSSNSNIMEKPDQPRKIIRRKKRRRDDLSFGRNYMYLPIRKQSKRGFVVEMSPAMKKKRAEEKRTKLLALIPWRTLPENIGPDQPLPKVYTWHPPQSIREGYKIVPRIPNPDEDKIYNWHPPYAYDARIIKRILNSLPKFIDEKSIMPFKKTFPDPYPGISNEQKRETVVKFLPSVTDKLGQQDIDKRDKTVSKNGTSLKPILKESKAMEIDRDGDDLNEQKDNQINIRRRGLDDVNNDGRISPPLIIMPYPDTPLEYLEPVCSKYHEPIEPKVKVDLSSNPLNDCKQKLIRLEDQKTAWLLTEYRVSQIRQHQPKNIWDINNMKMIDLMRSKGASIDSSVREDAKKALKFLEEKQAILIGKHGEVRNKMLQFCLDYAFDFEDKTVDGDDVFYLKQGDFIIQLELDRYRIKDGWYFWNISEPIHAPNFVALLNKERWEEAYTAVTRVMSIIPSSLTSEDKDIVYQSLTLMENDLERYHKDIQFKSHIFALNDILPRTDVTPFSVILPRPPVDEQADLIKTESITEKYESCRDLAILKVQFDSMNRHRFALQSCLTPNPFLTWINPEFHKIGAAFLIKFKRPIAVRYGAYRQLQTCADKINVEENYVNAYSTIVRLAHPQTPVSLADITKKYILRFEMDQSSEDRCRDYLISGFYLSHPKQVLCALYCIKREVILNRLCESTCEQDPLKLPYSQSHMKSKLYIRLGEMVDGKLKFYFNYLCYAVEVCIFVNDYGEVNLSRIRAVHHGNRIRHGYLTVYDFVQLIDKRYVIEPVEFTEEQISSLNEIIFSTWNIPKLIDQMMTFLKKKCRIMSAQLHYYIPRNVGDKTDDKVDQEEFKKLKNQLKELVEEEEEKRAKITDDHSQEKGDDQNKQNDDDNADGDGGSSRPGSNAKISKDGKDSQKQSPEKDNHYMSNGSDSSSDFDSETIEKYKDKLLKYTMENMKKLVAGLKSLKTSERKSVYDLIKNYNLKLNNDEDTVLGDDDAELKEFLNEYSDERSTMDEKKKWYKKWKENKRKNLPLLFIDSKEINKREDIKITKNYLHNMWYNKKQWKKRRKMILNKKGRRFDWHKINIYSDNLGTSWNKFLNKLNDDIDEYTVEEKPLIIWQMCSDQRVTMRNKSNKDDQEDLVNEFEELDEYFNISDTEDQENMYKYSTTPPKLLPSMPKVNPDNITSINGIITRLMPNTKKILMESINKLKEDHKDKKGILNLDDVEANKMYVKLVKRQRKMKSRKEVNHDARPTFSSFIKMATYRNSKELPLFPNEAIKHAALALRDGPFLEPAYVPAPPPNTPALASKESNKKDKSKELTHMHNIEGIEKVISRDDSEPTLTPEEEALTSDYEDVETLDKSDDAESGIDVTELPPTSPILTEAKIIAHEKLLQKFLEPPLQQGSPQLYIEQIRTKLLKIWECFKPYYPTEAAFERMIDIHGPLAIYKQLEQQLSLLQAKKRDEIKQQQYIKYHIQQQQQAQQQQQQQLNMPHLSQQQMQHQQYQQQRPMNFNHMNPNFVPLSQYQQRMQQPGGPMGFQPQFDPQGQFPPQSHDFFNESSSSSAVSTPTSAGPLQSPFTPTRSKRGRGGKRATMGDRTPSIEASMVGSPNDLSKIKRGRPRKNNTVAPSPLGNMPPQSPIARNYPPGAPGSVPYGQMPGFNSSFPGQSPQQFPQGYPRFGYPQQSPQQQMLPQMQNYPRPGLIQQSFPYQGYESSTSDDEETDPPLPKNPIPKEVQNQVNETEKVEQQPMSVPTPVLESPSVETIKLDKPTIAETSRGKTPPRTDESKDKQKVEKKKLKILESSSEGKKEKSKKDKEKHTRVIISDSDDSIGSPKLKKKENNEEQKKPKIRAKSPEIKLRSKEIKEKRETENFKERENALNQLQEERLKKKQREKKKMEEQMKLQQQTKKDKPEKSDKVEKSVEKVAKPLTEEERLKEKKERKEKRRLEKEKAEKERLKQERKEEKKKIKKDISENSGVKEVKEGVISKEKKELLLLKEKEREKERERERKRKRKSNTEEESTETSSQKASPNKLVKSASDKKLGELLMKKKIDPSKKEKRRLPGDELDPPPKKFKDGLIDFPKFNFEFPQHPITATKKPIQAEIVPEPGMVVEIPIALVNKLYEAHCCNSQKNIERMKKKCMERASTMHSELNTILDDRKRLMAMLESAQEKFNKELVEIESRIANDKTKDSSQIRKESKLKSKSGSSLFEKVQGSESAIDKKSAASRSARALQEMDPQSAVKAALEAVEGNKIGMEALKSFKIPKVQDAQLDKDKDKEKDKEKEKKKDEAEKDKDKERDDDNDREDRERDRDRDRERDRDRRHDFHNRRYSADYERRHEGDRRYDANERRSDRYEDYSHDYPHRDNYSRGGFHHYPDRRRGSGGGYSHSRPHNRSPRGETFERRGGGPHYPHHNRGGSFRGRGGGFREDRRDWKGHGGPRTHDDFYEGLPPKQQQLNREAGAGSDEHAFPHEEYPESKITPRHGPNFEASGPAGFLQPPQRKVLLPNRMTGEQPRAPYDQANPGQNRPGNWGHFFNQSAPAGSSSQPSSRQPSGSSFSSSYDNRRPSQSQEAKPPNRPRETNRDSSPDIGLQIDESD